MRGLRSKIIGYEAAARSIGQYSEVTKSLKRSEKVIKPRVSKRQVRLSKRTSNF